MKIKFIIILILNLLQIGYASESLHNLFEVYVKVCEKKDRSQQLIVFNKMQMKAFNLTHDLDKTMSEKDQEIIDTFFAYHLPKESQLRKTRASLGMAFHQIHETLKDKNLKELKSNIEDLNSEIDVVFKKKSPEIAQKIQACMK